MFFCEQKINFILPVVKYIVNLLFWVLLASLVMHIQNDTTNLIQNDTTYLSGGKKKFIAHFFSGYIEKISQRCILGTLGMPG